jgi:membrane protein
VGWLKSKLDAFQRSGLGLFFKKIIDDQLPNLATLLAWGTLSTVLPLMLGILGLAGMVLRDPQRLDAVYNTLLGLVPAEAAAPLGEALRGVREGAAPAGIFAIVLLVFNGSSLFASMASVFDQAYHVEGRNFIVQRAIAIVMLVVVSALLVLSTLALSIGTFIASTAIILPIGPAIVSATSWAISILATFLLFVLVYKVLPNARQGWRDVVPGALLSSVLFFVISLVFPFYVSVFPPNQAYAVFGVLLVFMFWLYLLGIVFVLGAELNAFLRGPARPILDRAPARDQSVSTAHPLSS